MLSFVYALLTTECAGAAYSVGLDPYVGFLHKDRPGRQSLALDLMEEFRAPIADRLVLTLINKQEVNAKNFKKQENGAVIMDDTTRKLVVQKWQEGKGGDYYASIFERKSTSRSIAICTGDAFSKVSKG